MRKSEALARNRGHRPENARNWPRAIGSALEMWLTTKTTPPVCGILSCPRQSRRVSGRATRLSSVTTTKIVPRPGSRLAWASDRAAAERSTGRSAIHTSGRRYTVALLGGPREPTGFTPRNEGPRTGARAVALEDPPAPTMAASTSDGHVRRGRAGRRRGRPQTERVRKVAARPSRAASAAAGLDDGARHPARPGDRRVPGGRGERAAGARLPPGPGRPRGVRGTGAGPARE